MKINRIIWLESIVEKLATKHDIEKEDVIEVLSNKPRFRFVENGHRDNEDVYAAMGQTDGGRYVIIFFIHKTNNDALIVSAREMTKTERKLYEKK